MFKRRYQQSKWRLVPPLFAIDYFCWRNSKNTPENVYTKYKCIQKKRNVVSFVYGRDYLRCLRIVRKSHKIGILVKFHSIGMIVAIEYI